MNKITLILSLLLSANALFAQSNSTNSTKNSNNANPIEDSLLQILSAETEAQVRFNTYMELSDYTMRYSLEKSKKYLHQATAIANEQSNSEWLASTNMVLGQIEATSGNYDVALKLFEDALATYKTLDNIPKIISCLNGLGIINRRKGNFLEAVKVLESAKSYFDSDEILDEEKGSILNNLSSAYSNINLYSKAIDAIFESLKYRESAGDNLGLGHSYGNIGLIYHEQKKYAAAIENYEQSLQILEKENDLLGQMNALHNLSVVYAATEKFEKALVLRKKGLELAQQLGAEERIWNAQLGLANGHMRLGKYDEAKTTLDNLDIQVVQDNLRYLYNYYTSYSSLYDAIKQYPKALKYGEKTLELAQQMGNNKLTSNILKQLHHIYHKNNQPDKAYQFLLKYQAVNDSLVNTSNVEALTTQKLQFEFAKEQEVLQLEKEALEGQVHIQRLTRWALLGLLFFVGCIVVLGYRHYKKENRLLESDLENKKVIEAQAKELKKYNEELRQLDETKTQFFTNVSHEFKTPLTLILNPVSRLISNGRLNDEDKFLAQSAEQNSLQLLSLTNQVLELTKFEVDKVSNQPSAFNLAATARKLHADFESLAVSQKVQFDYKIAVNEALNLYFDYTKLTTILKNLLSNAIKFTPENGTVLLKVLEKENDIEIQIIDNGRGIHPSDLPNIFKRYYQASFSSQIQEGGTGIGLAICAEYTKLLGGEIRVQSAYGEGSTFVLTLPKTIAPEGTPTNMIAEPNSNNVQIVPTSPIQNKALPTILLVEDNVDLQNYLKLILQNDYQLKIASHGKAALNILEKKHQNIQLIISDVMMPEMNGYELLERLKQNANYSNIPTVMLTALSGTDDKLRALRIGIDDYLTKPFADEELKARIANLIQNRTERLVYLQDTEPAQKVNHIKTNQKDLEWLEALETYINRNLKYSLSTEMIATHLNISQKTLYNKIKLLTGLTPTKYINEIRYQVARRLIAENDNWTVKAIALKVGFKDEKNFSRNFKKRFGKYPSAYLM